MGKFADEAYRFEVDLSELFNRAIRQALMAGLAMAVRTTASVAEPKEQKGNKKPTSNKGRQDSSNSAAHWTIKVKGQTRSSGRAWSKLRDLRYTKTRKRTPPIGKRRDMGINTEATIQFVREREMRDVVEKFVAGRRPSTVFSFFNPIEPGTEYGENLNLSQAGEAAVQEVHRIFNQRIEAGKTRKRRL